MIIMSYLLAGVFAGLVAGLLGVGGGIVVVPVLILAFEAQGFAEQIMTHMAIGTSLATIVFTSASSVFRHNKLNGVAWPMFWPLCLGIVFGAIGGVITVVQLDGALLKKMIGVFVILVAMKMLFVPALGGNRAQPAKTMLAFAGTLIGWVSAMFGIGGGTLSVPFLSQYRMQMKQIVGTSAACGIPIAVVGSLTNMLVGAGEASLPTWSVGYVYLPALLGVSLASIVFAQIGAKVAHRLSADWLRRLFAFTLVAVGLRFLLFT